MQFTADWLLKLMKPQTAHSIQRTSKNKSGYNWVTKRSETNYRKLETNTIRNSFRYCFRSVDDQNSIFFIAFHTNCAKWTLNWVASCYALFVFFYLTVSPRSHFICAAKRKGFCCAVVCQLPFSLFSLLRFFFICRNSFLLDDAPSCTWCLI